jgi:hypothetical protein
LLEDLGCDGVEIEQTNCQMFSQFPTESHWSWVFIGRKTPVVGREITVGLKSVGNWFVVSQHNHNPIPEAPNLCENDDRPRRTRDEAYAYV